jgi:hypothetical protein
MEGVRKIPIPITTPMMKEAPVKTVSDCSGFEPFFVVASVMSRPH